MPRPTRWAVAAALSFAIIGVAAAFPPAWLEEVAASLAAPDREQIQAREAHWRGLDASGRQALEQRHARWQSLPLARRRELHDAWQAWVSLSATERTALREAARQRAWLPRDEQLALRAEFDALDASERRGWLLGPELGRDWPALQPLVAYVPPRQREALLRTLRQMDPLQRADLGVLVQRTPPQQRPALRQELLDTPLAQRAQWLRARMGG